MVVFLVPVNESLLISLRLLIVANPSHFNWTFCTLMLAENLEERAVQTFPLEMALEKPTNVDFQFLVAPFEIPFIDAVVLGQFKKARKDKKTFAKTGAGKGSTGVRARTIGQHIIK